MDSTNSDHLAFVARLSFDIRCCVTCIALLLFACSRAVAADIDLATASSRLSLDSLVQYMEDPGAALSLKQVQSLPAVRWQAHQSNVPNFGFTRSAYWFRFKLHNSGRSRQERLLEVAYPILDYIDIFQFDGDKLQQHWQLGDKYPFEQRAFSHRNFVVPIGLDAQSRGEIWVRVRTTSSMQVPMTLNTSSALALKDQQESLLFGMYGGVAIAMLAYNLALFLGGRDFTYLAYLLWVANLSTFLASINGLTFQFLWPQAVWWNDQVIVVTMCGLGASACLFSMKFLSIAKRMPRLIGPIRTLIGVTMMLAIGALFLPYNLLIRPAMTVMLLLTMLIGFISIRSLLAGFKPARFFALAFFLVLAGGAMLNFNKFGVIPRNWLTEYTTPIGSMFEMILFALALADRFNSERRERESAQRQMVRSQARVLHIQQEANEALEQRVAERTAELASANRLLSGYLARMSRLQAISELGPSLVHELKQPLAAIRSFAQGTLTLMDRERLQAPSVSYGLNRILVTVAEALALMARLRSFISREETQRELMDLNECLQEAVRWVRPMCSGAAVVLDVSLKPDLPLIYADPTLIRQVVLNLIRNALESIEAAGSVERVIFAETFSRQQWVGCRIRDSGPGIDANLRQQIFEPLFSTKSGGLGLGLKMSQSIVEEYGGRLLIEAPERGASIVFEFCVEQGAAQDS